MNNYRRGWSPRRNTPGYVYVLVGDNGLYKIGSTNQLAERLWQISHYTGIKCDLYYSVETQNMHALETKLHKQFKAQRITGEWFDLTPQLLGDVVLSMNKGC